jgi:hypothetical protein
MCYTKIKTLEVTIIIYFDYQGINFVLLSHVNKRFNVNILHRAKDNIITIYKTNDAFARIQEVCKLRHTIYRVNIISVADVCSIFKEYYQDKYFDLLKELNLEDGDENMATGNYETPENCCERPATELEQLQSENYYLHKELDELIQKDKNNEMRIQQLIEQLNAAKYILSR